MSSYLAERYHRNKSIRWGLILRSTSYCWFCISNVRYHLCLWTMCCFSNALLFFFFYQNLICFIDTSKKQILMKTRNEEKNIKTHKKPKLYPILFLRKYDFQNIEYVILKWISIKKLEFLLMLLIRRRRWWQSFIRYMKVMDSAYLLQTGFALLLTLLYCWIK